MLPFSAERSVYQTANGFLSYGTMNSHVDPAQAPPALATPRPTKKPWAGFQALEFVRQVDLVLPRTCAAAVRQALASAAAADEPGPGRARYARVVMTLGQVLEGEFFKAYVKAGSVLMLSQGRPSQDNVFALRDGRLTLFLERETYERAGLVGKPQGAKGGRGLRPRWVVEFDLNAKSMWPGKSGFERLRYACKNVLNTPVVWLFCNLLDTPDPDPLAALSPTILTAAPVVQDHDRIRIPPLGRPAVIVEGDRVHGASVDDVEDLVELYEWLSLVRLGSPRLADADTIDPFLCRYRVPGGERQAEVAEGGDRGRQTETAPETTVDDVCVVRWQGFLSPAWVCQTLRVVLAAMPSPQTWFSLSATSFANAQGLATGKGAECTLFRPAQAPGEYMQWEVRGHE